MMKLPTPSSILKSYEWATCGIPYTIILKCNTLLFIYYALFAISEVFGF